MSKSAFECSNEECKETFQLRKDFDGLIKSVVNVRDKSLSGTFLILYDGCVRQCQMCTFVENIRVLRF